MAWSNGPVELFHGTDSGSLAAYGPLTSGAPLPRPFPISLRLCRPFTDFGQGFYTTTSLHQAKEWANARARRATRSPRGSAAIAVVLAFTVDRDWLASLESLMFVRPIQDYWDFVTACRTGLAPHGRATLSGLYDVVYGPVTIWPQRLLILDCDQISFHTPGAIGALPTPIVAALAYAPSGLFP